MAFEKHYRITKKVHSEDQQAMVYSKDHAFLDKKENMLTTYLAYRLNMAGRPRPDHDQHMLTFSLNGG